MRRKLFKAKLPGFSKNKPPRRGCISNSKRLFKSSHGHSSFPIASAGYYAAERRYREEKLAIIRQLEPYAADTERLLIIAQDDDCLADTQCLARCFIALRRGEPLPELPFGDLKEYLEYVKNLPRAKAL